MNRSVRSVAAFLGLVLFNLNSPLMAQCNPTLNSGTVSDIQDELDMLNDVPGSGCTSKSLTLSGSFAPTPVTGNDTVYIYENGITVTGQSANNRAVLNSIRVNLDASNVTLQHLHFRDTHSGSVVAIGATAPINNPDLNAGNSSNNLVTKNKFEDVFATGGGGEIINVLPFATNHGNRIVDNEIFDWGHGAEFVAGIRVGNNRLQIGNLQLPLGMNALPGDLFRADQPMIPSGTPINGVLTDRFLPDRSYMVWPDFTTKTIIRDNKFHHSDDFNPIGHYAVNNEHTVAIQLYNPSIVEDNEILGGTGNGISAKGSDNEIRRNEITRAQTDGALYVRDGHNNVYEANRVLNNPNAAAVWMWSSQDTVFRNNVFSGNEWMLYLNGARHSPGSRPLGWTPDQNPLSGVTFPSELAGNTSHQFATENVLFLNNSFLNNTNGVNWVSSPGMEPATDIYFVNNVIWNTGNAFTGCCAPNIDVSFFHNLIRSDFTITNSGYNLVELQNSSVITPPVALTAPYAQEEIARSGGFQGSLPEFFEIEAISTSRGAELPLSGVSVSLVQTNMEDGSDGWFVDDSTGEKQYVSAGCAQDIRTALGLGNQSEFRDWNTFASYVDYDPPLDCSGVEAALGL